MNHSEFRKDQISGDWILVAPRRARVKGKNLFEKRKQKKVSSCSSSCPFKDPFKNVDEHIILQYPPGVRRTGADAWKIIVLKNKYPAVAPSVYGKRNSVAGTILGIGHHDLVITRDHNKNFAKLSPKLSFELFRIFQERYKTLSFEKNTAYISIFHNWGYLAGASVHHPHYQILSIPVVPSSRKIILKNAMSYYKKSKKCLMCESIKMEKKHKKRIVFETEHVVAFCPFASRYEFEVKIFPKSHEPFFEKSSPLCLEEISRALKFVLGKIEKRLGGVDYNFFLRTTPFEGGERNAGFSHWYVDVRPVLNLPAGFEYDTGIEVNVIDPDIAAKILEDKS